MSKSNLKGLEAYEVITEKRIDDVSSDAVLLRHKKTGARISVLENDDDNKVFFIGFRTPVDNSTGVPHIIEHTVLCGSDAFPVKDPFVELAKGSLNTFLNAMTYPDKTMYPVASTNDKDFNNLIHVYLDAVFYPNIYKYEEIFKQEGWHYELESEDGPVTINGVVYNEMKGAFSSSDSVLERKILNSLFPDNTYANESGGDPDVIPTLTYEDYLDFHRKYYHPSNSYIYLYGDMDMCEKLEWIDENYLSKFDNAPVDSEIKIQKPFEKPIEIRDYYPIAENDSLEDNTYLSYNVVVNTNSDEKIKIAMDTIDYALFSAPGAPVRQALIDAGIGKDIQSGLDNSTRQSIFSIIAKMANLKDKEKFLEIIKTSLLEQAEKGINKKALLAGLNSAEFAFREADFGGYPRGLIYGLSCMDSWLYDEDKPWTSIEAGWVYDDLRKEINENTGYFENLIKEYLLDNTHSSVVIIEPKKGLNAEKEKELADKLDEYKKSLSEEEIKKLIDDTNHLKEYQATPSPKEDLEKIPLLKREDLKKEIREYRNEELEIAGIKTVLHNYDTRGIAYVSFVFDSNCVTEEEYGYLSLLKRIISFVDTENYSYNDLASEIDLCMGGLSFTQERYEDYRNEKDSKNTFELRMRVLYGNMERAFEIATEILTKTKLDNKKRIKEIIAKRKAALQNSLVSSGHVTAYTRAGSYMNEAARLEDIANGIEQYRLVSELEKNFDKNADEIISKFKEIMDKVINKNNLVVSFTSEKKYFEDFAKEAAKLINALPAGSSCERKLKVKLEKKNEGFKCAGQVQYVARTGNFKTAGYDFTGALLVLRTIMSYEYLWINIRVQGGAYGCMCAFGRTGNGYFVSYRDPNLSKTNEIYERIPKYLEEFDCDDRDMTKFLIGTLSNLDIPLNPAALGQRSFRAFMDGLTEEEIQKTRNEVLGITKEDIQKLAPYMKAILDSDCICVVGNEDKLKEEDLGLKLEDLL